MAIELHRYPHEDDEKGRYRVSAKLLPLDPAHREMIGASGMGEREVQFYADVAPSVDLRVPRAYWAEAGEDGGFVLLLEDLADGGCVFPDGVRGVTSDAAAGALEDLARFHGRFADPAVRSAVAPWLSVPRVRRTDLTFAVLDHSVRTDESRHNADPAATTFTDATRAAAARHGIRLFDVDDPEQGISHVVAGEAVSGRRAGAPG